MEEKQSNSLKEFTLFKKLPMELRLKIWSFALLGQPPRRIRVMQKKVDAKNGDLRNAGHFYTDTPLPITLHICQESRKEALKVYELLEIKQYNPNSRALQLLRALHNSVRVKAPPMTDFRTYINYSEDYLYLDPSRMIFSSEEYHWDKHQLCPGLPVLKFVDSLLQHPRAGRKLQNITLEWDAFFSDKNFLIASDIFDALIKISDFRTFSIKSEYDEHDILNAERNWNNAISSFARHRIARRYERERLTFYGPFYSDNIVGWFTWDHPFIFEQTESERAAFVKGETVDSRGCVRKGIIVGLIGKMVKQKTACDVSIRRRPRIIFRKDRTERGSRKEQASQGYQGKRKANTA